MSFRPLFSRDRLWASLVTLAIFLLILLLAAVIVRQPLGPGTVILGVLMLLLLVTGGVLLYRLWALHSLDYWVERDAIHIHWNGEEAIIPLSDIRDIRPADAAIQPAWWRWPQQWIDTDDEKDVVSYASQPPQQCLAIHTDKDAYLISPDDPRAFISAFEERRDFGPARRLKQVIYLSSWRQHWLLTDRLAQLLMAGGLLLGLFVLAYTIWRFPQLPETIAIHFNASGDPDLLSPRRSIFLPPAIALLTGFLNAAIGFALYDYQRFFSYILWSVSIILQIAILFVTATLISLSVGG
jgi:hypothetical protein